MLCDFPDVFHVFNIRYGRDSPEFGGAEDPGERHAVSLHQSFTHGGSGALPAGSVQRAGQPVHHLPLHTHTHTHKRYARYKQEALQSPIVRKISLVTGLSFNLRIYVFLILSRMEGVITYRASTSS